MATILRTSNLPGAPDSEIKVPVIYVDSINCDSYNSEMHNICVRHIRENTVSKDDSFKRDEHIAKDENDIYYKKKDGLYYIPNEKTRTFVVYKRTTSTGYVYNSTTVEKLFTLTCVECKRIVPQVFKKTTLFDDFSSELRTKVTDYRDRTLKK
ncbi:hypothetical protein YASMINEVIRUS_81 [Yasminevirus sp. GU-2018]|uniref:Uncharacterized protein n=1 Tax=Yasminevirus sp. GU-2018 TaxID=2420051 RepID=A0A5K0U6R4_9VIRU|nr:hypothetical protein YASMINEVIRUS_81 [Yasminevirus sp. GU-2018]